MTSIEHWKQQYTRQLLELTKRWNNHEDVPRSQQLECKAIGKNLNHVGGMSAMQDAYREARAANKDVHVIQAYWHGIGGWQW